MRNDNVLLAGVRPDPGDGIKVRLFPDGHVSVSFLGKNGHEIRVIELSGIEDLKELAHVVNRAVLRYKELNSDDGSYLQTVRRTLAPQTADIEAALMNVR